MTWLTRRRPAMRRGHDAARRVRAHLDRAGLLRATVAESEAAVPRVRASVWLSDARGTPRLAYPVPDGDAPPAPPHVLGSINRRKRLRDVSNGIYAFPLRAPRSGVIGALYVQAPEASSLTADEQELLEDIATEAGFALETSNLFERSVAERERSEAILSRVADAVIVTDGQGSLRQFNRSAVDIFGFEPHAAAGRSCAQVLGLRLGERTLDCATGCALLQLSSAATGPGVEVSRVREDGRKQPLLGNAAAVIGADGMVHEVVHSFRDITSLKEADEAKTMFLATASHELKTPLTVIRGFSEMLMGTGVGSAGADGAVEAIARRSIELNRIVDRILLSSRIESGRVDVSMRDVDVAPILLERTDAFARATGRWARAILEPRLPLVRCDPEAFASVIDHLIENAIKYSPDGGSIDVHAHASSTTVSIDVVDHGIGMSAEHAGRAFEKFFQAESSDVRRFGGTGIGLYIVRSLVEAMGGTVSLASALGRGSTFTVSLQRCDVALEPLAEAIEPEPAEAPEPSVIREFMRQMGIPTGGTTGGRR